MAPTVRPLSATFGVLAAASLSTPSPSDGAPALKPLPSSTSNWQSRNTSLLLNRVPRGGSSSKEQSTNEEEMRGGGKQHSKKKRRSKSERKEETTADTSKNTKSHQGNPTEKSNDNESILPPEISHILSQSCHYSVLDIPKSASQGDILKAYRKKCVLTHPDKLPKGVGDRREAFDKVSKAYDVLGCEKKRAMYDRFGTSDEQEVHGMTGGMGMFGQDVFRDFFGGSAFFGDPFSTRRTPSSSSGGSSGNPFRRPPRNRDLRYNLEVTLEDLYKGTTKHVAIQQPNPLQPHFPLRKELEVKLTRGMMSGNSVKISGVVDSIPNCAPADVVFLLSERRHPVYTRRGCDLAMEIKISLAESVGGFKRSIQCLDGNVVVISPPRGEIYEREKKDANATMPILGEINSTQNTTAINDTEVIHIPLTIIQTGDVHVFRGKGMPKRGSTHSSPQHGDLYIQYVVEMLGGQSSKQMNKLSAEERIELARLLHKLEGKDYTFPCTESDNQVQYLEPASASNFGKSHPAENAHGDHLHQDEQYQPNDINDFFQRAFTGRTSFGRFDGGEAFQYFSSGRGFGNNDEDHRVECNQM